MSSKRISRDSGKTAKQLWAEYDKIDREYILMYYKSQDNPKMICITKKVPNPKYDPTLDQQVKAIDKKRSNVYKAYQKASRYEAYLKLKKEFEGN